MQRPHRRHDISDRIREFPNPHLPGGRESVASRLVTIAFFSTRSFGFFARKRHGKICLLIMTTGKIPIVGFVAGGMQGFGNNYSNFLSHILILNGL